MSRVGNAPIKIAEGVQVEIVDGGQFGHQLVKISGPRGSLEQSVRPGINTVVAGSELLVTRTNDQKQTKAYHGLYRALLNNMVTGVSAGFKKELDIVGIGYRAELQGTKVILSLGYSHKIEYNPPAGVQIEVPDQSTLVVSGVDSQLVGEVAAKIRSFRSPEPYKGKGVRYKTEVVRRKSVKKSA